MALIASHAKNPVHRRALLRTVPASDQITAGMNRYPLWKKAMPVNDRKRKRDSVLPANKKTPAGEKAWRTHVTVAREGLRGKMRRVR